MGFYLDKIKLTEIELPFIYNREFHKISYQYHHITPINYSVFSHAQEPLFSTITTYLPPLLIFHRIIELPSFSHEL